MRYQSALRVAAQRSTTFQKVGAVLVRGGSVISTGSASKGTHPLVARLAHLVGENRFSIHAEMDALLHLPLERIEGSTIYVMRVKQSGKLGLALPCKLCAFALHICGVKKVIFSTDTQEWEGMSIEELVAFHGLELSNGTFPLIGKKFGSNTLGAIPASWSMPLPI